MSDIVEMYRAAVEPGGRDRFSCSVPTWTLLQELGHTFGWHPLGTAYVAPARLQVEAPARHDYRPAGTLDQKQIAHDDAIAWASALALARDSPHLPAMITARAAAIKAAGGQVSEALVPGVMEEFVEFAFGGAFTFVLSCSGETP